MFQNIRRFQGDGVARLPQKQSSRLNEKKNHEARKKNSLISLLLVLCVSGTLGSTVGCGETYGSYFTEVDIGLGATVADHFFTYVERGVPNCTYTLKEHYYCRLCDGYFDAETKQRTTFDALKLTAAQGAEFVNADNHNPEEVWTRDATHHMHTCKNGCGTELDKAAHSFDGGVCTVCGQES